jgi:hypothetical protein
MRRRTRLGRHLVRRPRPSGSPPFAAASLHWLCIDVWSLRVLSAFDFTSAYAAVIYVIGGLLVLVAAVEKLWGWGSWFHRWRKRPETVDAPQQPDDPLVVLGHPGGSLSLHQPDGQEYRELETVRPRYLIENKEPLIGIRDVTTGVRTRQGRSFTFTDFHAGLIGPRESACVENVGSMPGNFLRGVHESDAYTAFLYWARFTHNGRRWEVVYDPNTRRNSYSQVPPATPELHARVVSEEDASSGRKHETVEIANTGDVIVESVEIELPPEGGAWGFIFETLANYPIRSLEPGDTARVLITPVVGAETSIEVILRGRADGVSYERRRMLTLI